jgi:hypothetical protein
LALFLPFVLNLNIGERLLPPDTYSTHLFKIIFSEHKTSQERIVSSALEPEGVTRYGKGLTLLESHIGIIRPSTRLPNLAGGIGENAFA